MAHTSAPFLVDCRGANTTLPPDGSELPTVYSSAQVDYCVLYVLLDVLLFEFSTSLRWAFPATYMWMVGLHLPKFKVVI